MVPFTFLFARVLGLRVDVRKSSAYTEPGAAATGSYGQPCTNAVGVDHTYPSLPLRVLYRGYKSSIPAEVVLQPDNVVFSQIVTSLYFNENQSFTAGVLNSVGRANSNIDRLPR